MSPDSEWLQTSDGLTWLDSPDGHSWLVTDEGNAWFTRTEQGRAWGRSEAGDRYMEALFQQGWDAYFSGRIEAEAPPGWFTPQTAPRIGSRVRFAETSVTMAGTETTAGELAIVAELRITPRGAVQVHLRTIDGRKMITFREDSIEPA
jgi:hypothetical protein